MGDGGHVDNMPASWEGGGGGGELGLGLGRGKVLRKASRDISLVGNWPAEGLLRRGRGWVRVRLGVRGVGVRVRAGERSPLVKWVSCRPCQPLLLLLSAACLSTEVAEGLPARNTRRMCR